MGFKHFRHDATPTSQAISFVERLRPYFKEVKRNSGLLLSDLNVTERVPDARNISSWAVSKITSESTKVTPGKKIPYKSIRNNVYEFTEILSRTIYIFVEEDKSCS